VITGSAFLQLADTNGNEPLVERPSDNMLPKLCGAKYPSNSPIQARKTMHITYWASTSPPGTVPDGAFDETITTYQQNGADQFMRQLRDAVNACPTEQRDGLTYRNRILSGTARGDETVLVEQRYPTRDVNGNPVGGDDVRLVSVVRRSWCCTSRAGRTVSRPSSRSSTRSPARHSRVCSPGSAELRAVPGTELSRTGHRRRPRGGQPA